MSDTHTSSCSDDKKGSGGFSAFLKIVAGILLFGFLTGSVICRFRASNKTFDEARAVERAKKLADLRAKEAVLLENYAVVDEAKGLYRIPISKAMEIVTEEMKNKPLHAAGVIPVK